MFDNKQRFSLRKLTVGLASVLLGLTFMTAANTNKVQAAEQPGATQDTGVSTTDDDSDDLEVPAVPAHPGDNIDSHYGYDAQDQNVTIHYKDDQGNPAKDKNGNVIPDGQVNGKTDEKPDTPIPDGWKTKNPADTTTDLSNPGSNDKVPGDKDVTIEHGTHTTNPGETHKAGDKIEVTDQEKKDQPGLKTGDDNTYKTDITDNDVKKEIGQKVTVETPTGDVTVDSNGKQTVAHSDTTLSDQKVDYQRGAIVDTVTGDVKGYTDWTLDPNSKHGFDAVTNIPDVTGYTTVIKDSDGNVVKTIPAVDAPTSQDEINNYKEKNYTISYIANTQNRIYHIVDDDGGTSRDVTVSGVSDQTISDDTVSKDLGIDLNKYTINAGQDDKLKGFKFGRTKEANPEITIHIAHNIQKDFDPNKNAIPDGAKKSDGTKVTKDDFSENITRTITFHDPTHESSSSFKDRGASQTVTITRTGSYDPVTNIMSFNPWDATKSFDAVDVPAVDGYTVHITKNGQPVSDTTIGTEGAVDGYKDPKIDVTYTANDHTVTYQFVDDDQGGAQVGSDITVTGKTDDTSTTGLAKPDHYDFVDANQMPASVHFDGQSPATQVIKIHLTEHKSGTISGDEAIEKGATDVTDPKNVHKVTNDDFEKTLDETITVMEPTHDNSTSTNAVDHSQHVKITRVGIYNEVTNQIIGWKDWTDANFTEYNAGDILGYTVSDNHDVAAKTVKSADVASYKDPHIVITYTANDQSQSYQFVDDTTGQNLGKVITITGKTDDTVDTGLKMPENYDLVAGSSVPTSYKMLATGNASADHPILIHVAEQKNNNGGKDDVNGATTGPDGKPINIADPTNNDFSKTLTRTITVKIPTHDDENSTKDYTVTQTITVTRTGVYNKVTNKIEKWNDWTTGTFEAYDPTNDTKVDKNNLAGYTLQNTVAAQTVTNADVLAGYKDSKPVVTYKADQQKQYYQFVDNDTGEKIGSPIEIDGVTDQTVDPSKTINLPANYDLAPGVTIPTSYKMLATGNASAANTSPINLKEHRNTAGTEKDINGDTKDKNGNKVTSDDFNKTLHRTITINEPTGENSGARKDVDESQTIHLHRTATINTKTNVVEGWGDWQVVDDTGNVIPDGGFNEVDVPEFDGYTSSASKIDKLVVNQTNADSYTDTPVTITYTANDGHQNIQFVNDDGTQAVDRDGKALTGVVNAKTDDKGDITLPDGWVFVDGQDHQVKVSGATKNQDTPVQVKVKHGTTTVTITDDKGDILPEYKDKKNIYTTDDIIPGTQGQKFYSNLTNDDLVGVGKRTIVITIPSSHKASEYEEFLSHYGAVTVDPAKNTITVVQEVHFWRSAVIDQVTGKVDHYVGDRDVQDMRTGRTEPWNADHGYQFGAVKIPKINGYKAALKDGETTLKTTPTGFELNRLFFASFMALPGQGDWGHKQVDNTHGSAPDDHPVQDPDKNKGTDGKLGPVDPNKVIDRNPDGKDPETLPGGDKYKGDQGNTGKEDPNKGKGDNKGNEDPNKGQSQGNKDQSKGTESQGQNTTPTVPSQSPDNKGQENTGNKPAVPTDNNKGNETTDQNNGQTEDKNAGKTDKKVPSKKTNKKGASKSNAKKTSNKKSLNDNRRGIRNMVTTVTTTEAPANGENAPANEVQNIGVGATQNGAETAKVAGQGAGSDTVQAATVNGDKQGQLPQTGENKTNVGFLGGLLALVGLTGLFGARKRRKQD